MAGLSAIVPRPPTPPRSSSHLELSSDIEPQVVKQWKTTDTPDDSPASYTNSLDSGSGKNRKRVDFSPWTPPVFTPTSATQQPIRSLPPSRECKSSTSILKMSAQSSMIARSEPQSVHSYDSLNDMLKSVLQQLAVDSRSTNIDAYATVAGTFKAYNNVAEGSNVKDQVQSLCRYIRRDLQHDAGTGVGDSNIITSALKVAVILVWDKNLAAMLTDEFRSFLLDRSMHVLEDEKSTKAVILHYLHLLATQNFKTNVMTNSRANRMLDAMKSLTLRIAGNNMINERHMVYQKFTEQAPTVMKAKVDWIEHLINGMTDSAPFVRNKAITFGAAAAKAFGGSSSVCKNLNSVFDRELDDGQNYLTNVIRKLDSLLGAQDSGQAVPTIWAIIIRLLRGSNLQSFERGKHLKRLLVLIQRCFNSPNPDIRTAAYSAWNQFIFVVRPSDKTPVMLRHVLATPIVGQLARSDAGKISKSHRAAAASSYCCLLYYSFRPGAVHEQYSSLFQEYVSNVWTDPFLSIPSNVDRACRILIALFWNEKGRFWTENRVHEINAFDPEDLPRIDSKWVRSQSKQILDAFKILFRRAYWGPQSYENSFVARAWTSFSQALGEACRKEVKPSSDTVETVANFLALLRDIWEDGPISLNASDAVTADAFLDRFYFLMRTIVLQIGGIPFTEPSIHQSSENAFVSRSDTRSTDTPSHTTPVEFLLLFLQRPPAHLPVDRARFVSIVEDIFKLFVDGRASVASRLQFYATSLTKVLDSGSVDGVGGPENLRESIMHASLLMTRDTLRLEIDSTMGKQQGTSPSVETQLLRILKSTLQANIAEAQPWNETFKAAIGYVKGLRGNRVAILDILVPLAHELATKLSPVATLNTAALVCTFAEAREFWSVSATPSKTMTGLTKHPWLVLETVSSALSTHLLRSYDFSSTDEVLSIRQIVDAAATLVRLCPENQLEICLLGITNALVKWLEDSDKYLDGVQDLSTAKRSSARTLWSIVISRLCETKNDSETLETFEALFTSCFNSKQRDVVNLMIEKWNSSFGTAESLDYPAELERTLLRLHPYVELELPGLKTNEFNNDLSSPPKFSEPYEDDNTTAPIQSDMFLPAPFTPRRTSRPPSFGHADSRRTHVAKALSATPPPSRRVEIKKKKVARTFQHNDSQLDFAVIGNSSPMDHDMESQYLTEHQREVRERQKLDVASAFLDLRSSPTRESERTRRSESVGLPAVFADKVTAEPSTPDVAPNGTTDADDHVMSSPTPQSSHKTDKISDVEIPSSPIGGHEEQATLTSPNISTLPKENHEPVLEASMRLQKQLISENFDPEALVEDAEDGFPAREESSGVLCEISPNIQSQSHNGKVDNGEEEERSKKAVTENGDSLTDIELLCDDDAHTQRNEQELPRGNNPQQSNPIETDKDPGKIHNPQQTSTSGLSLVDEDEVAAPHPESDDFDSQIGIQLSQEIEHYADSWETVPDLETLTNGELSTICDEAQAESVDMGRPAKHGKKRVVSKELSSSLPAAEEMVGDTITVEGSRGHVESNYDGTTNTLSPRVQVVISTPLEQSAVIDLSTASATMKRKAEALPNGGVTSDPTGSEAEATPTKRARIAASNGHEHPPSLANGAVQPQDGSTVDEKAQALPPGITPTKSPINGQGQANSAVQQDNPVDDRSLVGPEEFQIGTTGSGIISSLQDVRSRLGQAKLSMEELKSIHELMFEIRFAAQDCVQRPL